jgi:salicylate hydroxylase
MGGTGSSIALQDAEHLCESLLAVQNGEKELIPALYEYEVEMLDYGFKAVQNSMMASRQFIEDSAWSPLLVSTILKILNLFPALKQSFFRNLG